MAHRRPVDLEVRQRGRARREGVDEITALSCHSKLTRRQRSARLHTDLFIPPASPACSALARPLYLPAAAVQLHTHTHTE